MLMPAPGGITLPATLVPCRNKDGDETETAARLSVTPQQSSRRPPHPEAMVADEAVWACTV